MGENSRKESRNSKKDRNKDGKEGKTLRRRMSNLASSVLPGASREQLPLPSIETPWAIEESVDAWALSDDGGTLYHMRKGHDICIADIVLKEGVTKVSFKITASHNNKGHNMYLGVLDAGVEREAPVVPPEKQRRLASARLGTPGKAGQAWGYHPYDGFLYYSSDAYQRGYRATTDSSSELPHMRGESAGQTLNMEIDMNNKRLRMGVNTMTLVDMGITLPSSVSPYVFLDWREDAVEIMGSIIPSAPRVPMHRYVEAKQGRSGKGLLTARAQALKGSTRKASKDFSNGSGRVEPLASAPASSKATDMNSYITPSKPYDANPMKGLEGSESMHLEVAIGALLAIHMSDVNIIARALPGFSLGEDPSADLMMKELLRVRRKLDPSLEA